MRISYLGDDPLESTVLSNFEHLLRLEEKGDPCDERPRSSYFFTGIVSTITVDWTDVL
jgi:hypothetical protein